MNWTKFSIATLIGGIVYFFLGWLIFGIILRDATAMPADIAAIAEYPEEEFKMSLMIVSCLAWSALLTFIFMRWANISTFLGGFKAGAIIGVLNTLAVGLSMASMYKFNSVSQTLLNMGGELFDSGLAGGAIGWYLGRGKQ